MTAAGTAAIGILFFILAAALRALVTPTEKQREAEDEEFMEFLKNRRTGGRDR